MGPVKVVLLACGSFSPPTNMHLRMFEIARDHLHRMGQYNVVGGFISPVHDDYGKNDLEPAKHRIQMIKLALQSNDWVKVSEWESKQTSWTKTKVVLQYHQNLINSIVQNTLNHGDENTYNWLPQDLKNSTDPVKVKLLCGADLLESFGTPGLWAEEDIEAIVGNQGIIVITRTNCNPLEFIYKSDVLTKFMHNITIVTEWIQNEVSSTKIRRALKRSESVKYLLQDSVIDYIYKHCLYNTKQAKYLSPTVIPYYNTNYLTPSPSDVVMESPSPTNCMVICNNNLFSRSPTNDNKRLLSIDMVDSKAGTKRHPGQAVKIITDDTGDHTVITDNKVPKIEKTVARPACLL